MKFTPPAIITAIMILLLSPASAATVDFENSIISIQASLICDKEEKKDKKGSEEEEPDCD